MQLSLLHSLFDSYRRSNPAILVIITYLSINSHQLWRQTQIIWSRHAYQLEFVKIDTSITNSVTTKHQIMINCTHIQYPHKWGAFSIPPLTDIRPRNAFPAICLASLYISRYEKTCDYRNKCEMRNICVYLLWNRSPSFSFKFIPSMETSPSLPVIGKLYDFLRLKKVARWFCVN